MLSFPAGGWDPTLSGLLVKLTYSKENIARGLRAVKGIYITKNLG